MGAGPHDGSAGASSASLASLSWRSPSRASDGIAGNQSPDRRLDSRRSDQHLSAWPTDVVQAEYTRSGKDVWASRLVTGGLQGMHGHIIGCRVCPSATRGGAWSHGGREEPRGGAGGSTFLN